MAEAYPRMVFGYPMNISKVKNQYIVRISELDIKEKSESKGGAIRLIFKRAKELLKEKPFNPKAPDEKYTYHHDILLRMVKVNQKLTDFGFSVLADDLTEPELLKLEDIVKYIDLNKDYSTVEYKEIENRIAEVFKDCLLDVRHYALNMNSLIKKTEHVKKFSHIIEQAYISFFRGEYISTVMCLTPVIEGILLSLYGFNLYDKKPEENKLLNMWAELEYKYETPQMIHPFMVDEYIRAFIELWQKTIFLEHHKADGKMFYNRHYIAHLMGDGGFYSRNNAFKLITMIDLLVHVISACNGQHFRFNFNTSDEEFLKRLNYYHKLKLMGLLDNIHLELMETQEHFKGY